MGWALLIVSLLILPQLKLVFAFSEVRFMAPWLVQERSRDKHPRLTNRKRKRRRLGVPSAGCSTTDDLSMLSQDLERGGVPTLMHLEKAKLPALIVLCKVK